MQQVPLMIGRPPEHDANRSDPGTRFLVAIEFAHLGPIQIDGFVSSAERRFDLTLRSTLGFDEEIKTGAREKFSAAMLAGGFKGKLVFHITNPFPVQNPDGLPRVPVVGLKDWLGKSD